MARKAKEAEMDTQEALNRIVHYSLEDIMGDAFGRYSKYIIQDRAIPDIRDGLKPVQRRILYSMYKEKNTYDKPTRKSAKTVGDVIGNFHPHGDSSIYEAMVRMSQNWKMRHPYIDMQGNNGSIDGDPPAAYRYTEARLSKISNELLKDIDKDTVNMAPNFDDTLLEPTVLPAKYPNLLVNGATGISAGYATNIPPHNLGEVIDATIYRIDNPNCRLETLMNMVKGPDFPTGGIAIGADGIRSAYTTGRGKIIVRSKTHFEEEKNHFSLIVTEIPYEVNKALLVRKIDELRIDKTIDGIIEVRDETDKEGLRIAIDLKPDANKEFILNYLLKNTDLQVSYSFNMVAICDREPKQVGLIEILDAYIRHQQEFILRRTKFDLNNFKKRLHIVEGLIKCISILDEVVQTIRHSKDKADAKKNLVKEYGFTEEQAEAIVVLQLYRLTNTDVTLLEEEMKKLQIIVAGLERILNSEDELRNVMKQELRNIKKEYALPRITEIESVAEEINIDMTAMIPKEDVITLVTKDGYVKRVSMKSYQASSTDEAQVKEGDYPLGIFEQNTLDTLLLFTNKGNYLQVPVHTLPDLKWKELGKHISNLIKMEELEEIVAALPVHDFEADCDITIATKDGMIKRTKLKEFKASRTSKPITCMKLKGGDEVITAFYTTAPDLFLATHNGYGLWYEANEVPIIGLKAAGVKSMTLKDDEIVSVQNFAPNEQEQVIVITTSGTAKRVRLPEFEKTSRARRGLLLLREVKTKPYHVLTTYIVSHKKLIGLKGTDISYIKPTEIPILDRYSTGSSIYRGNLMTTFIKAEKETCEELQQKEESTGVEIIKEPENKTKPKVSLKEIDDRLLTIDDFLEQNDN